MKTFLQNLGLSSFEADAVSKAFGSRCIEMFESMSGRKELSSVVESSSIEAAHLQYCRIWLAKVLFSRLESAGFSKELIYRYYLQSGEDEEAAISSAVADPYSLCFCVDAPFPAADALAKELSSTDAYKASSSARVRAAVYAALALAERGSEEQGDDPLSVRIADYAGSMCLPVSELVSVTQLLLGSDISEEEIIGAAKDLHRKKLLLLTKHTVDGEAAMFAYRKIAAETEYNLATQIKERRELSESNPVDFGKSIYEAIDTAQAALERFLSYEQANAVAMALTNRISVITGGPGTGKTATQNVLLETYRRLSGGKQVMLMAPTGQAAKMMTKNTGYPATTIHVALGIMPGEVDPNAGKDLSPGLIIVDESSMVDEYLFGMLLNRISKDTILVVVGDTDQLPSIGAGCILRELMKCVPVTRLTKVFRQGEGSEVAYNAARIKAGTKQMLTGTKFSFIPASGSENIQNTICDLYEKEAAEHGAENVMVLTPLRKRTLTGVNQLNEALRKTVSSETKYISRDGIRIYEKDKVMFLKNRLGLVNGDIGTVNKVWSDGVECEFHGKTLRLSGSQLSWILPAYAQTVHKSQGDQYKIVIMVSDGAHRQSRAHVYTALTRTVEKCYVVGQKDVFEEAIETVSKGRYSCLSALANDM